MAPPIGNEVVIDDAAFASRLSVKELGDGSLIFSWLRQDQDSVQSYVALKYDAQGQKVGPPREGVLNGGGRATR